MKVIAQKGPFRVFEHQKDLSVTPNEAISAYFAEKMNARKRQVFVEIGKTGCVMQAGAMQWMLGNVTMDTGVQGVGNFLGKMVGASVSGESAVKPHYYGNGVVMLEPTYKHILLMDVAEWGCLVLDNDQVKIDGNMAIAWSGSLNFTVERSGKSLLGSAASGEGLVNVYRGSGKILLAPTR